MLATWPSRHAVEAELHERMGVGEAARAAWARALACSDQPGMRARITDRMVALNPS